MRKSALAFAFLAAAPAPHALEGQRLIERTPNLPNSVNALPGFLEASLPHRFSRGGEEEGLASATTFDLALGIPFLAPVHWTAGLRFAPLSDVVPGRSDEWEVYERLGVLRQTAGGPLDVALTGAYNVAGESFDAEVSLARRVGPVRLIGAARAMSSPYGEEDGRFAVAGGAVLHVAPRSSPLTLAADVATLVDREEGEEVAWSAAVQVGLPYTTMSVSILASNASTTTLQGASVGRERTRYGFELNAPVEFAGFLLGWFTGRQEALRSVAEDPEAVPTASVRIRGYLYQPSTVVIRAGETVEWLNEDDVVHTVSAENGAFDSGGIQSGERWRARFDAPGRFPYYCGPHPFMKGVIIVRPASGEAAGR